MADEDELTPDQTEKLLHFQVIMHHSYIPSVLVSYVVHFALNSLQNFKLNMKTNGRV